MRDGNRNAQAAEEFVRDSVRIYLPGTGGSGLVGGGPGQGGRWVVAGIVEEVVVLLLLLWWWWWLLL